MKSRPELSFRYSQSLSTLRNFIEFGKPAFQGDEIANVNFLYDDIVHVAY